MEGEWFSFNVLDKSFFVLKIANPHATCLYPMRALPPIVWTVHDVLNVNNPLAKLDDNAKHSEELDGYTKGSIYSAA